MKDKLSFKSGIEGAGTGPDTFDVNEVLKVLARLIAKAILDSHHKYNPKYYEDTTITKESYPDL